VATEVALSFEPEKKGKSEGTPAVTIVGGGLAGCEAALFLARQGHSVRLVEMKPQRRTPAQTTDRLCELVCSNSLRSDNPENAIGLLHEELRRSGSAVLAAADKARVPAGDALAVDRGIFSGLIEEAIASEPGITLEAREVEAIPETGLTVLATGPLTAPALAASLGEIVGEKLYFYDAIAPIVSHESIDHTVAFAQSRYDKGDGADYLNLPFSRTEYERFVAALLAGNKVVPHAFEEPKYFEGCLPIEVMAERGLDVLAYGPMKPVGLRDPRTGQRPHAVVQLRREDKAGTSWNIVGFQTRLTWPEQKRIFRECVPGLQNAEFLRMGQIHRNTFVAGPRVLAADLSLRARPDVFLAGQITGVEGYVESAACGHLVARSIDARLRGNRFVPPPQGTAFGALYGHVTGSAHPADYDYQPTNVTWGLFPPPDARVKKHERRQRMVERARTLLTGWLSDRGEGAPLPSTPAAAETRIA
jgi:methylenetetrahydrofolate--tRNA-(uracil-5-)-methyltransferase